LTGSVIAVVPNQLAAAIEMPHQTQDVNTVLIAVELPGQHSQIGIELRPSRLATAWIAWLTITLLVIAFWLPSSRRRGRVRRYS
jgi:hypothetical protein